MRIQYFAIFAICALDAMCAAEEISVSNKASIAPSHECVSEADRQRVLKESAAYEAAHPGKFAALRSREGGSLSTGLYKFFPQAGLLWSDLFITNFVDQDPTTGILDYHCGNGSYDGHRGIDCALTSFGKQDIGVPIYAVYDGIVTSAHDGEPDKNTEWNGQVANYVVVTLADGRRSLYWHMKTNSVMVAVGESVVAGQQLGLTGSSGVSTGPHLHFETQITGTSREPFSGNCRSGESLWAVQPDYNTEFGLLEFTLTQDDMNLWEGSPHETNTRTGYVETGLQRICFWVKLKNTPADAIRNTRFIRPNGSVRYDLGTRPLPGPYRRSTWSYIYNINFDVPGEWTVEYSAAGVVTRAPLTVVLPGSPRPNRNPLPVSIALKPAAPAPDDVVATEVTNWNVVDDPDYDLLRYRYVWKRDNVVVRDVTTAALSDYLPRTFATSGARLECEVTVTDGNGGSATMASASAIVSGASGVGTWWGY